MSAFIVVDVKVKHPGKPGRCSALAKFEGEFLDTVA
jgi:hypothetical protein